MDLKEKISLLEDSGELLSQIDKFHSDLFEKGRKEYILPMSERVFDNLEGYDQMDVQTKARFNSFKRKAESMVDYMLACQGIILRHNRIRLKIEDLNASMDELYHNPKVPMSIKVKIKDLYESRSDLR